MQLMLVNQSSHRIPRKFLQKWVKDIAKFAMKDIDLQRYRNKELVVAFLDEKPARELNKQYRGKNYATDVLSFESEDPSSLGELVICPHVIAEQAKEHGLTVQQELGYMVLHGFLHLLGYDHETTEDEAELMFELQDRLFDKLLSTGRSIATVRARGSAKTRAKTSAKTPAKTSAKSSGKKKVGGSR